MFLWSIHVVLKLAAMPWLVSLFTVAAGFVRAVAGDYFPPTPEGLTVVESKYQEGVKISYKEVIPVCYLFNITV